MDSLNCCRTSFLKNALRLLRDAWNQSCPIETNDFSLLLKYRLLCETRRSLCEYQDISEDLANRIIRNRNQFLNFEQFCQLLKTKELTYSRISRGLLHILLAVKKEDMLRYRESSCIYTRILGFRKEHADVLRQIKEKRQHSGYYKIRADRFASSGNNTNAGSDHFCIRSVRKRSVRQVRNSFHKRIPKADHTCIVYKSFFRQQRSFPVQAQKNV